MRMVFHRIVPNARIVILTLFRDKACHDADARIGGHIGRPAGQDMMMEMA